jgi:hypothetical protein
MGCGCGGVTPADVKALRVERAWRCAVHAVGVTRHTGELRWWCGRCKRFLGPAEVTRADGGPVPQTDEQLTALTRGEWGV